MAFIVSPHSLKTRITLASLLVFLAGMWSLSFYASQVLRRDMERMLGEQQLSTASYVATEINVQLEERIKTLEQIAQSIDINLQNNPAVLQRFLDERFVSRSTFNEGLRAYRKDGTVIAATPLITERIGRNYMDRDYLVGAIREGKTTIGRPVDSRALPAPVIVIATPVRDMNGQIIGALSGVTNLNQPNFLDRVSSSHYGKSGGYLLVDARNRLIITSTGRNRMLEPSPPLGAFPVIDRFLAGHQGSAVYVNPTGVEVLQSTATIPVAGWYVAASLSTDEAFAPIKDMQKHMLLATLLVTLLASGVIW